MNEWICKIRPPPRREWEESHKSKYARRCDRTHNMPPRSLTHHNRLRPTAAAGTTSTVRVPTNILPKSAVPANVARAKTLQARPKINPPPPPPPAAKPNATAPTPARIAPAMQTKATDPKKALQPPRMPTRSASTTKKPCACAKYR